MERKRVFCGESVCVSCCCSGPFKDEGKRERVCVECTGGRVYSISCWFAFSVFCFCRLPCRGERERERGTTFPSFSKLRTGRAQLYVTVNI